MSILSFLRHIFGQPIQYEVIKLNKNKRYMFKIDSDSPEIIKHFMKILNKAHKAGENIYVPKDVEIEEKDIKLKFKEENGKWKQFK